MYLTALFQKAFGMSNTESESVNTHLICMDDSFADAENNLSVSFFAILTRSRLTSKVSPTKGGRLLASVDDLCVVTENNCSSF